MMNNMSQGLGSFNNMMPQNNMMQQNPYGQQMNPQMMGQQMQSPEMFSEQLMNPMMSQIQDPMQGLQPMAEPEGFGVYGQSLEGYAEGGEAVPRETEIMGQPHMLAYINPEEEMMLRQMGGSGMAGPGGVPSYPPSTQSGPGANVGPSSDRGTRGSANNDRDERIRAASNLAKLQAQAAAAEKMMADQAAEKFAAETLAAQKSSAMPDNTVTASTGPITAANLANLDAVTAGLNTDGNTATTSTAADTALKTSLVPKSRPADLTDNSKTSGIMSVVNDVKSGIKNFIEDVGMTYAGGIGSFKDLTNSDNYDDQYRKLVEAGYAPNNVADYLDTTRAGQTAIRKKTLDIKKTISPEERAIMKDERLADEARLASAASTAVGTGIDTIPISTSLPSGAGTVGANYGGDTQTATGGFVPSSDFNPETGEFYSNSNTYGQMDDGSLFYMELINGQPVYRITQRPDLPDLSFDNYQEAYSYVTGTPYTPPAPVMPPPSVTPSPIVTPDPIVAPDPVVAQPIVPPAATVDPMTPVGGNFLLPGQQNYGPTPAAALNFNPNTYMQTPQNANVALSAMFQGSNPYTFEELLSQYKPAYSSFG